MSDQTTPAISASAPPSMRPDEVGMSEKARAILARFHANDKTITPAEARRLFRERPGLLKTTGNPAHTVLLAWMSKSYGADDCVHRQAVILNIERVRDELAGPDASPAERLLAERAALCWAEVNSLELCLAVGQTNQPISSANYWLRRVDSANRRFLAALRTLEVVRKLGVPGLQVNIDARSVKLGSQPGSALGGIDDGRAG